MAGCEWRQDADGFRYFVTDYRDATSQERYAVFEARAQAAQEVGGRLPVLVLGAVGESDPVWFKGVKDHNVSTRGEDARVALVGLGSRGAALAAILNARVAHERTRSFDDEASAVAWLRETS